MKKFFKLLTTLSVLTITTNYFGAYKAIAETTTPEKITLNEEVVLTYEDFEQRNIYSLFYKYNNSILEEKKSIMDFLIDTYGIDIIEIYSVDPTDDCFE